MSDGDDPTPVEVFCADLRRRWRASGRDLPGVAREIGISRAQLYAILSGDIRRPPDWAGLVRPLLQACGGSDAELAEWRQRHEILVGIHEGLRRRRPEHTEAVRQTPEQLPADVAGFTGRAAELALLDSAPAGVVVISGPPGVGKSALAVHWAHSAAARFPDGQLYLDLHGFDGGADPRDPGDAIRQLLDGFGVEPDRIPAGRDAQAALYRSLTAQRRLLVVLDNARDGDQVRPLLPAGAQVRTVVTSRRRLTSIVAGLGARPLSLDVLPIPEAVELFHRRIGAPPPDPAPAAEIVDACGRLPLALALAAARVRVTGFPLATLAAELRRPGGRLEALDDGEGDGVRAVFSWSYDCLSPAAARTFRLLGMVTSPGIAVAAAAALTGRPVPDVRRALRELTDAGLLSEPTPGRYTVHGLLRAYAGELARHAELADGRRAALTRLLDHYTHTAYHADLVLNPTRAPIPLALGAPADGARPAPPIDMKAALTWLSNERETLLAALRQAKDEGLDAQAWQLTWALDSVLHEQRRWHDEGAAWAVALDAAAALTDEPALAYAYTFLAVADGRRSRFDEAQAHMRRALDLTQAAGDRAGEAECYFTLSYVCWLQGKQDSALEHAGRALALFRALGDPTWEGKASMAVGWYHVGRGETADALTFLTGALSLQQKSDDHANEAVTRDILGLLQLQLGDYEQAIRHFEVALRLARDTGNPVLEAQVLGHVGDLHEALGDSATAGSRWRQAYDIFTDLDHPQAADLRRKLVTAPVPEPLVTSPGAGRRHEHSRPYHGHGQVARDTDDSVRAHRLRRGMSQEDLAARTGLSVRTIRYIESGRAGRSRPETLRLLSDALGLEGPERERFHRAG
jgi:tetratricopeptide (TPR) repeat protein/DNA-binding Xre family transcriptional regulator